MPHPGSGPIGPGADGGTDGGGASGDGEAGGCCETGDGGGSVLLALLVFLITIARRGARRRDMLTACASR